jgi:hypothetical protein
MLRSLNIVSVGPFWSIASTKDGFVLQLSAPTPEITIVVNEIETGRHVEACDT